MLRRRVSPHSLYTISENALEMVCWFVFSQAGLPVGSAEKDGAEVLSQKLRPSSLGTHQSLHVENNCRIMPQRSGRVNREI